MSCQCKCLRIWYNRGMETRQAVTILVVMMTPFAIKSWAHALVWSAQFAWKAMKVLWS